MKVSLKPNKTVHFHDISPGEGFVAGGFAYLKLEGARGGYNAVILYTGCLVMFDGSRVVRPANLEVIER